MQLTIRSVNNAAVFSSCGGNEMITINLLVCVGMKVNRPTEAEMITSRKKGKSSIIGSFSPVLFKFTPIPQSSTVEW